MGELNPLQVQVTQIAPDDFEILRAILRKAKQFYARGRTNSRSVKLNLVFSTQV
jgi:hypothetical protein